MAGSALKRLMAEYKRECGDTESVEWFLVAYIYRADIELTRRHCSRCVSPPHAL